MKPKPIIGWTLFIGIMVVIFGSIAREIGMPEFIQILKEVGIVFGVFGLLIVAIWLITDGKIFKE